MKDEAWRSKKAKPVRKPVRKPAVRKETPLERRLGQLERYVQNNIERHNGADNLIRDRLDALEATVSDLVDGTATMQVDRAVTVDQRYLSGRWIRKDGTDYAPLKENGHDEGSGQAARKRGRALRGGGQGASQSR